MRRIGVLALAMLVACAAAEPLRGVDLPPASLPDQFEPAVWSIDFRHRFAPGTWSEGEHSYSLSLDCPVALDQPIQTPTLSFQVNSRTQVLDGEVYIRLVGLADSPAGPRNVITISIEQPTTAVITLLGVPESTAQTASEDCQGRITYDSVYTAPLLPGEPFRA